MCAIHAKRVTIMPKDIQLAGRIRGEKFEGDKKNYGALEEELSGVKKRRGGGGGQGGGGGGQRGRGGNRN